MKKPKIDNLTALIIKRDLDVYQKADALNEFNKLLNYIEHLEDTINNLRKIERLKQFMK